MKHVTLHAWLVDSSILISLDRSIEHFCQAINDSHPPLTTHTHTHVEATQFSKEHPFWGDSMFRFHQRLREDIPNGHATTLLKEVETPGFTGSDWTSKVYNVDS